MKNRQLKSLVAAIVSTMLIPQASADWTPYISGGISQSLQDTSKEVGGHLKAGAMITPVWGIELGYYAMGEHRFDTPDYYADFHIAGGSAGLIARPFHDKNWFAQPYFSVSAYSTLSSVENQYKDGNGNQAACISLGTCEKKSMAIGDFSGIATVGLETELFEKIDGYFEASNMFAHPLLDSYFFASVGLKYRFGEREGFSLKEKNSDVEPVIQEEVKEEQLKPLPVVDEKESAQPVEEKAPELEKKAEPVPEAAKPISPTPVPVVKTTAPKVEKPTEQVAECTESPEKCLKGQTWVQVGLYSKQYGKVIRYLDKQQISFKVFDFKARNRVLNSVVAGPYTGVSDPQIKTLQQQLQRDLGIKDSFVVQY